MKRTIQMALGGFVLGLVLAVSPSCGPTEPPCNESTCSGCCDADGVCQNGSVPQACGVGGAACQICASDQLCQAGSCTGGSNNNNNNTNQNAAAFNTFCNTFSDTYCNEMIACGLITQAQKPQCVTAVQKLGCFANAAAIRLGAQSFDTARGQECLNAVAAMSESCDGEVPDACADLSAPAAKSGERCLTSLDCVVEGELCGGSGCNRTCRTSAGGLGDPCGSGTPCQDAYWCDTTSGSGVCAHPKGTGQPCFGFTNECQGYCDFSTDTCKPLPVENETCAVGSMCAPGLHCDFGSGTCQVSPGIGDECTSVCTEDAWCDFTQPTPTCQARRDVGDTCSFDGQCKASLRCQNGQCESRAQQGEACTSFFDCADGLSCDSVLKTCQKGRGAGQGESCTGSAIYCQGDLNCRGVMSNPDGGVGTAGTCEPPVLGDTCFGDYSCPKAAHCQKSDAGSDGICAASVTGSPCSDDDNCPAGHFCDSSSSTATCQPRIGKGQSCAGVEEGCMAPYACIGGICDDPKPTGSACTDRSECMGFDDCIEGECTPVGFQGQPCIGYIGCYDGACEGADPDAGVRGTCGPGKENGSPCSLPFECKSNLCLDGICQSCN